MIFLLPLYHISQMGITAHYLTNFYSSIFAEAIQFEIKLESLPVSLQGPSPIQFVEANSFQPGNKSKNFTL